jgi:hypothetical protein
VSTGTSIGIGILIGLLASAVLMLTTLMHYVSQDMEGFRKWLDRKEP